MDSAIHGIETALHRGEIDLDLGDPQAQRSNVAFESADAGRKFVEAEVDTVEALVQPHEVGAQKIKNLSFVRHTVRAKLEKCGG